MVVDKVSNLINALKVAGKAKLKTVVFPYSKFAESIVKTLKKEGFVTDFSVSSVEGKKMKNLEIHIGYEENGTPRISDAKRVSKLSRRSYKKAQDIKPFKNGYGLTVFSTPKGVLSDKDARKEKVGGEELFKVW